MREYIKSEREIREFPTLDDFAEKTLQDFLEPFMENPNGLKDHVLLSPLYEIFEAAEQGRITQEESHNQAHVFLNGLHKTLVRMWAETFFELQTGKKLEDIEKALEEGDREAAIELVRVFKTPMKTNPVIRKMIETAEVAGDFDFVERIGKAYREVEKDSNGRPTFLGRRLYWKWFIFAKFNEDCIRNLSSKEKFKLAKRHGIVSDREEDNFKKYLHRLGIKKESRGRPRKS